MIPEPCPVDGCNDTGSYPDHGAYCDGTCSNGSCPVEVQCEFCYTTKNSVFNLRRFKMTVIEERVKANQCPICTKSLVGLETKVVKHPKHGNVFICKHHPVVEC